MSPRRFEPKRLGGHLSTLARRDDNAQRGLDRVVTRAQRTEAWVADATSSPSRAISLRRTVAGACVASHAAGAISSSYQKRVGEIGRHWIGAVRRGRVGFTLG